jgi:ATP-dependent Lon protease
VEKFEITPKLVEEYLDHPIFLGPEELNKRTSIPGVVPVWHGLLLAAIFCLSKPLPCPVGAVFKSLALLVTSCKSQHGRRLSYVRSRADSLAFLVNFFEKHDIHMHIPSGAQPKDGPICWGDDGHFSRVA